MSVEARAETATPCAVRYTKAPEGRDDILWRAEFDRAFCDRKAQELVARLRGAGWNCGKATARKNHHRMAVASAVSAPPRRRPAGPIRPDGVKRSAEPVARIEAPPAEPAPPPSTLRERLVRDARLRFYRNSFGASALRDALRIVRLDLNDDGRDELFLQVDLPELCPERPCSWDLFQLAPDGSLATLGVRGVLDWKTLGDRRHGFPDLAVRFARRPEAAYGLFRFELGMYRLIEPNVVAPPPDSVRVSSGEGRPLDASPNASP